MGVPHKSSSTSGAVDDGRTLLVQEGSVVTSEPLTRSLDLAWSGCGSDDGHQYRRNEGEARAEDERARRSGTIPDPAEYQRCRERAQANGEIIPAEGGTAPNLRNDVGDERLLRTLGHSIEDAIDGEQRPRLPRRASPRESEVNGRVQQPPADDQRPTPQPIRQLTTISARCRLHEIEHRPENRSQRDGNAQLIGAQQQERIGRIAEREQQNHCQIDPEPPAQFSALAGRLGRLPSSILALHVADDDDENQHRDGRRNRGQPEDVPDRELVVRRQVLGRVEGSDAVQLEQQKGHQRSYDGTRVVGGGMKAVGQPARVGRRGIGKERVTRRCAQSFTDAIGNANSQNLRRAVGRGSERSRHGRDQIPDHHERLSAFYLIRPPAAQELEQRSRRLSCAFDRPDEAGIGAEHARQKDRQERVDHLGRDIGEETHRAQTDDVPPQLPTFFPRSGLYDACTSEWSPTVTSPFTPSTTASSPTSEFLSTDAEIFALEPMIELLTWDPSSTLPAPIETLGPTLDLRRVTLSSI